MSPQDLRVDLLETARALRELRLSAGTSGNVSVRLGDGFLITPSGVRYETMSSTDLVELDLQGMSAPGSPKPSTEWRLHAGLYRSRPDVQSVVHAHPRHATALACTGRDIPPFHYMVAIAGGSSIPCAPYAPFGTDELAENAARTIEGQRACLLAHHGAVTVGSSLSEALALMEDVEALAAQYCTVLQIGGMTLLSAEEMAGMRERFGSYVRSRGTRAGDG